jgi:hypothetical protein
MTSPLPSPQPYPSSPNSSRSRNHQHVGRESKTGANDSDIFYHLENRQFEQAIHRIRQDPEVSRSVLSSRHPQGQGNLALHEACRYGASIELVEALIEANESALRTEGKWGYLPLHFACCSNASPQVISKLIVTYPSATRTKEDSEGGLPLHLAVKYGADSEVITALLTVYPKASIIRDRSGLTPMGHAEKLSSPSREILKVLRQAPTLVAVNKAVFAKIAHKCETKIQETVEFYQERIILSTERYDENIARSNDHVVELQKKFKNEKERTEDLSSKVERLKQMLQERESALQAKEKLLDRLQGLIASKKDATASLPLSPSKQVKESRFEGKALKREDPGMIERQNTATTNKDSSRRNLTNPDGNGIFRGVNPVRKERTVKELRDPPATNAQSEKDTKTKPHPPKSFPISHVKNWFSSINLSEDEDDAFASFHGSSRSARTSSQLVEAVIASTNDSEIQQKQPRYQSKRPRPIAGCLPAEGKPSLLNRSKNTKTPSTVFFSGKQDGQQSKVKPTYLAYNKEKSRFLDSPTYEYPSPYRSLRAVDRPSTTASKNVTTSTYSQRLLDEESVEDSTIISNAE